MNKNLRRIGSEKDNGDKPSTTIISERVIRITVEKESAEAAEKLFESASRFQERNLEAIRNHAKEHPDAIEERKTKSFRRLQYGWLLAFLVPLGVGIYFTNVVNSVIFGLLTLIITIGVLLNARERDIDFKHIIEMLRSIK